MHRVIAMERMICMARMLRVIGMEGSRMGAGIYRYAARFWKNHFA